MGIEQRRKIVKVRTRLGDLEADIMIVKAHKSALVVINDRKTLLNRLKKGTCQQIDHTEGAIEQMLTRIPKAYIKTLALD